MAEAVRLLEEACEERGIDLEALGPAPDPEPVDQVVEDVARAWGFALQALLGWHVLVILVPSKVARVNVQHPLDDADYDAFDTAPNLLLIERLLTEAADEVDRRRADADPALVARFDAQDRSLRGLLFPFYARVTSADRAAIAMLASRDLAPSPFSVRAEPAEPEMAPRTATRGEA